MQPQLSIIIVNYRSESFLDACLQSVEAGTHGITYEVLLVDNSPETGGCAALLNRYPSLRYLPMEGNAGFARANNQGIRMAKGQAVLLLNSDTVVLGNAIGECCKRLLAEEGLAAAGVQLQFDDGRPQISGSHNMTGALNYLMTIPYFGDWLRRMSRRAGVKKPGLENAGGSTMEVDWVNGAFLMVKRAAFERSGLLDEDFFLYHEESEWCGRISRYGRLCIFGDLSVIHLEGGSANKVFDSATSAYSNLTDRKGFQLLVSMWLRIRKQFGAGWLMVHVAAHVLGALLIWPVAALHALAAGTGVVRSAAGYSRNVLRGLAFVPDMLRGRPRFYKVL